MSTLDPHKPTILSLAGTFSADEIAEELDVTVSLLKQYCSKEGISLARTPEAKRKYHIIPCMTCRKDFKSTNRLTNRMCDKCRQNSLTVFDVVHRAGRENPPLHPHPCAIGDCLR